MNLKMGRHAWRAEWGLVWGVPQWCGVRRSM